ncbi:MAG: hypothetical protein EOO10_22345 [Chitinophagaceae bacterium]|nr:MAG: hypothetical protein EOO10_22345 [Chitinophagaceae bacterium]
MEYNLEDANKLVAFYKPLLKGKILEESTGYKIDTVETKTVNNKDFRVIAIAKVGSYHFHKDIDKVAKMHDLIAVEDILSGKGQ